MKSHIKHKAGHGEDEWFEPPFDIIETRRRPRRIRMLADEQFPAIDLAGLEAIDVQRLDAAMRGSSDGDIAVYALKNGRILLTLDAGFWNDKRHPLTRSGAIVFVDERPADWRSIQLALSLLYWGLLRWWPINPAGGFKIRARKEGFRLKTRSANGNGIARYQFAVRHGCIMVKEA